MANIYTRKSGSDSVVGVRQPMVEALRALAIVAVVANHVAPNLLPGGFLGVDVFFVISGYVISKVITGNVDKKGFLTDWFLFENRALRLAPPLTLTDDQAEQAVQAIRLALDQTTSNQQLATRS